MICRIREIRMIRSPDAPTIFVPSQQTKKSEPRKTFCGAREKQERRGFFEAQSKL